MFYQEFFVNSKRYNFLIALTIHDVNPVVYPIPYLRFLNLDSIELGSDNEDESVLYPGQITTKFYIVEGTPDGTINDFIMSLVQNDSTIQIFIKTLNFPFFPAEPHFQGLTDKDNINYDIFERVLQLKSSEPFNRLKSIPNTDYGIHGHRIRTIIQTMLRAAGCNCIGVVREPRFGFILDNPVITTPISENDYNFNQGEYYNIINSYVYSTYFFDANVTNKFPTYASVLKAITDSLFCYGVLNMDRKFYLINRKWTSEVTYPIDSNVDVIELQVEFTRKYDGMKQKTPNYNVIYGTYSANTGNNGINAKKQHDFSNEFVCGEDPPPNPNSSHYSTLFFSGINNTDRYIWHACNLSTPTIITGLYNLIGDDYWNTIKIDRLKLKVKLLEANITKWRINYFYTFDKFPGRVFRVTKIEWDFFEDWTTMILVEA